MTNANELTIFMVTYSQSNELDQMKMTHLSLLTA